METNLFTKSANTRQHKPESVSEDSPAQIPEIKKITA